LDNIAIQHQIFSLWTVSDRKYGGLSFASKDVGQVLTVAGNSIPANYLPKNFLKSPRRPLDQLFKFYG
jgi:hypothetical protein